MRENRTSSSEGGEGKPFPTPIAATSSRGESLHLDSGFRRNDDIVSNESKATALGITMASSGAGRNLDARFVTSAQVVPTISDRCTKNVAGAV